MGSKGTIIIKTVKTKKTIPPTPTNHKTQLKDKCQPILLESYSNQDSVNKTGKRQTDI